MGERPVGALDGALRHNERLRCLCSRAGKVKHLEFIELLDYLHEMRQGKGRGCDSMLDGRLPFSSLGHQD